MIEDLLVVDIDVLDPKSVQQAIDRFQRTFAGFDVKVDTATFATASEVYTNAGQKIHIGRKQDQPSWDDHEPGRLLNSLDILQNGSCSYTVKVDAKDNHGDAYASIEMARETYNDLYGQEMNHNFMDPFMDQDGEVIDLEIIERFTDHLIGEFR